MRGARSKIVVAALAATLVLAATAGIADARSLRFNSAGFLFKWRATGPLTFAAFGFSATCEIRFKGTFHSTSIGKVRENLIGTVTESRLTHPCEGDEAWILNGVEARTERERPFPNTLPWHLRYRSFSGTLPNITAVQFGVVGMSVLIQTVLESCLYRTTEAAPFVMTGIRERGGFFTGIRAEEASTIPVTTGSREWCRELTPNGTGTEITGVRKEVILEVRLI